jgi:hypothetical protein
MPLQAQSHAKQRFQWADANVEQGWTRVIFTNEAACEIGYELKKDADWRLLH